MLAGEPAAVLEQEPEVVHHPQVAVQERVLVQQVQEEKAVGLQIRVLVIAHLPLTPPPIPQIQEKE